MNLLLALVLAIPLCLLGNEEKEPTHFIWNLGIASCCDVGFPKNLEHYFQKPFSFKAKKYDHIKSGDILWISSHFVAKFYKQVLPLLKVPFVLVISDGDASFPSDCLKPHEVRRLLANRYLIHIFAQNCDYQGPSHKISPIPIGIDFHTIAYKTTNWGIKSSPKEQEALLVHQFQKAPPTSQRKLRAFVDFQHSDTMHDYFKRYLECGEDRASIFKTLLLTGMIDHGEWMPRDVLWEMKSQYAFSISPPGKT